MYTGIFILILCSMVWKTILLHLENGFCFWLFSISVLTLDKSVIPLDLPVKGGMVVLLLIRCFEIWGWKAFEEFSSWDFKISFFLNKKQLPSWRTNVPCFYCSLLWHLRIVSQIFLFSGNCVCEFCAHICAHESPAGRSRLSCLCRDSVTANCAPSCTPWPWQAAWHFGEACPDTALLKSSGVGTMNWLRNCLKIKGNWHFCKLFIWCGAPGINLSSFLSFLQSHQHYLGSGLQQQQGWWESHGLGQGDVSYFLTIINIVTVEILFWSALGFMWNKTNC